MIGAILILFLLYFILIILLLQGWHAAIKPHTLSSSIPFISIVVAVRNEEATIKNLLDDISNLEYPSDKFEVWVVNDHAEDKTGVVVEKWLEQHPSKQFHLVNLTVGKTGKKSAITEGISKAKGEIIVTTDADCHVQSGWLKSIAKAFDEPTQLVSGGVRLIPDKSFWDRLQMMEFASLIGTSAATLGLGKPTMCNGANLAYRKGAFQEVGGYAGNEQIPSGDDEFLLRKIVERYPKGIRFNTDPFGVVETRSAQTLPEFFNQRIRWAGKWRGHGIGISALLAVYVFLFHCSIVLLVVLGLMGKMAYQDVLLLLLAKMVFEAVFLFRVLKFLQIRFSMASFFVLQLVYPLYVIFFALTANFLRANWKGRRI